MEVTTDVARAVAALALETDVITPKMAIDLIDHAAGDDSKLVNGLWREVREEALLAAIAKEINLPFVDLSIPQSDLRIDSELLEGVNLDVLKDHATLLMRSSGGDVVAVMANPHDMNVISYLREEHGIDVTRALGVRDQVQTRLALLASGFSGNELDEFATTVVPDVTTVNRPTSPLMLWIDQLLERAVAEQASDVHFASQANGRLLVRLRVDGILRQVPASFPGRESEIVGALMTRAGMDPANLRDPQDGQFSFHAAGRVIDVRAAMLPEITGPAIVLRLLDSANIRRRLSEMGFSPDQLEMLRKFTKSNQGMAVVSGPTGSGKTTTLYALLREAASIERHVATIEDPVEYRLPLIGQVQVRNSAGRPLLFADALRALMRMDPDVLLVGEIRDAETAKVALDAAITGHLVFSTVHARDAAGTFERLIEIGAPPYVVADAVTVAVAQRLVRRVHSCARRRPPDEDELALMRRLRIDPPETLAQPVGCELCGNTGYKGRVAVVEVLTSTPKIRSLVRTMAGHDAIVAEAKASGFVSMAEHASGLLADGTTTLTEVGRILEDITDTGEL